MQNIYYKMKFKGPMYKKLREIGKTFVDAEIVIIIRRRSVLDGKNASFNVSFGVNNVEYLIRY